MPSPDATVQEIWARTPRLVDELQRVAAPETFEKIEELVASVSELYGQGLERIVAALTASAPELAHDLLTDPVVAGLLVLHDLHPVPVGDRVEQALDTVRPLLAQHGGGVELVDIDVAAGAVLVHLTGSCDGCPSSTETLRGAVEQAVLAAAPDIGLVDVVQPDQTGTRVPVAMGRKPAYDACPAEGRVG